MTKLERIKKYCEAGLWSITRVRNAVKKGWISSDDFEEITGIRY